MEIVLQWLDDLDDAVFAVVLAWERLRRLCVRAAVVSAAALGAYALAAADSILPLGVAAGLTVLVGLLGAALAVVSDALRSARP